MRSAKRLVKSGLFCALLYMFVYDSARMALLFGDSFLSWAAFQGTRLLDLPGTILFAWRYNEGELYNVSRNLLTCYRMGAAIAVFFIAGAILGFFLGAIREWGGSSDESPSLSEAEVSSKQTSGLAIASFVLALVGVVCLGFLLGFIAVILGAIASSHISSRREAGGKWLAIIGQIVGGMSTVIWTFALALEIK